MKLRAPGGPNPRPYVAPTRVPGPSAEDLVEDGMLIATAGVRMSVKNLILVRALRDNAAFDEDWYVEAVTHEFLALAAEKTDDARRVTEALARASTRKGRARSGADYRRVDAPMLERRIAALTGLADRLVEASGDTDRARDLVATARQSALEEIAGAVQADGESRQPDPDYERERDERLDLLVDDIDALRDAKWRRRQAAAGRLD